MSAILIKWEEKIEVRKIIEVSSEEFALLDKLGKVFDVESNKLFLKIERDLIKELKANHRNYIDESIVINGNGYLE